MKQLARALRVKFSNDPNVLKAGGCASCADPYCPGASVLNLAPDCPHRMLVHESLETHGYLLGTVP